MADETPEEKIRTPFQQQFIACSCILIPTVVIQIMTVREFDNLNVYQSFLSSSSLQALPLIAQFCGAVSSAFIMYYTGRKRCLVVSNILFFVPLIIFATDLNPILDYGGILCTHAAYRFMSVTSFVFVTEMSGPQTRAFFICMYFVGIDTGYMIGAYVTKGSRAPALLCLLLISVALIQSLRATETPYWLALRGQMDDAETLFEFLRGGEEADSDEFDAMADKAELDAETKARGLLRNLYAPNFFTPIAIVLFMYFGTANMCFLGDHLYFRLLVYYKHDIKYLVEENFFGDRVSIRTILTTVPPVLASLCVLCLTFFVGRRLMYLNSITLNTFMLMSNFTAAFNSRMFVYFFFLCRCFSSFGGNQVPQIIAAEIFPAIVREFGMAVTEFLMILVGKLQWISQYGGRYTWYYDVYLNTCFGLVPVGLVFSYLFVPETRNMTLEETEIFGRNLNISLQLRKGRKIGDDNDEEE